MSCWDEGERESRENKGGGGLTLWVDESAAHSSLLRSYYVVDSNSCVVVSVTLSCTWTCVAVKHL